MLISCWLCLIFYFCGKHNNMKKIILVFTLFVAAAAFNNANAQSYKNAIGVSLGSPSGISFKHFTTDSKALDFTAGFAFGNHYSGFSLTGMYEFHYDNIGVEGLRWYVGPGANVGVWNTKDNYDHDDGFTLGVNGVLGLDYKIKNAPLNLALDWRPALNFIGYTGFYAGQAAFAVRYTF